MFSRILAKPWLVAGVAVAAIGVLVFLWQPAVVHWHLRRARHLLRAGENQGALAELRAALRLAPDTAETHFLLARAHRRLGNLDKTPGLLRRAEKLGGARDRAERETWLLLAQSGLLREAEPHLDDLLMDPRDDGADICQAYVLGYFAQVRVTDAARLLDTWEKAYPEDPRPHFMRGYLLYGLGMRPEAEAAYRKGLGLAPGDLSARWRLAQVLMETQQIDEARVLLEGCVADDPANPQIVTSWAECVFRAGEADRAREALAQLLDSAPEHFEARRLRGEIALAQGRFEEARRELEAALNQRPYDTTTHNALGRALRALGRAPEAKAHFDYVAEAEGPLARMENHLRLIPERPHDVPLRYEIGLTLLRYGSPDDGAKWLRSVLELQPEHAGAHQALAAYYETRGDWRNARYHWQQAAAKESKS